MSLERNERWQSEPKQNLVTSLPVKKGEKLATVSQHIPSWEELRGLSWIIMEEKENFI